MSMFSLITVARTATNLYCL